jgi:LPXTG-motif cell wall-anchored protein
MVPRPMRRSQPITVLVLAATLALPAGASAQSAGEDHRDGGRDASAPAHREAVPWVHAPSLSRTPIASRESVTKDPPLPRIDAAAAAAVTAPATVPGPPAAELPRTGAETWLTLLAGAGLLLTGTGLRLRTAAPRR